METKTARVQTQMRIRKPVAQVFNAFIDPDITRNFWFTKGSDVLSSGKKVTWEWEMYNATTEVVVDEIIQNERILIKWGEPLTTVDFRFKELSDGSTYVTISNYGFDKSGDDLLAEINDSTGGFTTVLDGLKAYLEHGINLKLIEDKFPKEAIDHSL